MEEDLPLAHAQAVGILSCKLMTLLRCEPACAARAAKSLNTARPSPRSCDRQTANDLIRELSNVFGDETRTQAVVGVLRAKAAIEFGHIATWLGVSGKKTSVHSPRSLAAQRCRSRHSRRYRHDLAPQWRTRKGPPKVLLCRRAWP